MNEVTFSIKVVKTGNMRRLKRCRSKGKYKKKPKNWVKKRTLRGTYTLEPIQDLRVEYGLNVEQELIDMMAEEITKELKERNEID